MIHLVAKTQQNAAAFAKLIDYPPDPTNPMAEVSRVHCHYTLGFPYNHALVEELLECGYGRLTISDDVVLATANRQDWHNIARCLNNCDPNSRFKKFVTVLVNGFPEIFNDIPRTMQGDGQLMLR